MPGIVDSAVRGNEPGDDLLFGINRDRSFQEMFSDFTGSLGEIMAAVPAGKTGWVDSGYGNYIISGVKQVHSFLECEPEIERFDAAEEFLERREMRDECQVKDLLNPFHITNIFDEFPVMLVPEISEEDKDK